MAENNRQNRGRTPASNAPKSEVQDPSDANAVIETESEKAGLPVPLEENDFNSQPQ